MREVVENQLAKDRQDGAVSAVARDIGSVCYGSRRNDVIVFLPGFITLREGTGDNARYVMARLRPFVRRETPRKGYDSNTREWRRNITNSDASSVVHVQPSSSLPFTTYQPCAAVRVNSTSRETAILLREPGARPKNDGDERRCRAWRVVARDTSYRRSRAQRWQWWCPVHANARQFAPAGVCKRGVAKVWGGGVW